MASGAVTSFNGLSCRRCKAKLITGVKCVKCDNVFHTSCVKYYSQNVKILSDKNFVICCESGTMSGTEAEFFDAMEELSDKVGKTSEKAIYFYIIKQKDTLINELKDKVELLNKQVELLSKLVPTDFNTDKRSTTQRSETDMSEVKTVANDSDVNINQTKAKKLPQKSHHNKVNKHSSDVNKQAVSTEIMRIQTEQKCKEIINLTRTDLPTNIEVNVADVHRPEEGWQTANNRKKRKIIVGSNTVSSIRGVPRVVHLHVTRVDRETSVEDIKQMLCEHFPEVQCSPITPLRPNEYSSFKVTINQVNFRKAMNPNIWPVGACISKFFQKRPLNQVTT